MEPLGDNDLIDEYMNGFCHVLALALHDLLGMGIGLLTDGEDFRHYVAFNRHDPGQVVDVKGRRSLGDVLSDAYLGGHNPDPELVPQTRAGLLAQMGHGKPLAMPNLAGLEEAASLVSVYAQRIGVTIDKGRLSLFLALARRPQLDRPVPAVASASPAAPSMLEL